MKNSTQSSKRGGPRPNSGRHRQLDYTFGVVAITMKFPISLLAKLHVLAGGQKHRAEWIRTMIMNARLSQEQKLQLAIELKKAAQEEADAGDAD